MTTHELQGKLLKLSKLWETKGYSGQSQQCATYAHMKECHGTSLVPMLSGVLRQSLDKYNKCFMDGFNFN